MSGFCSLFVGFRASQTKATVNPIDRPVVPIYIRTINIILYPLRVTNELRQKITGSMAQHSSGVAEFLDGLAKLRDEEIPDSDCPVCYVKYGSPFDQIVKHAVRLPPCGHIVGSKVGYHSSFQFSSSSAFMARG